MPISLPTRSTPRAFASTGSPSKTFAPGIILPDSAERVTSVEWCADNRTLFYTTEDPVTKRSNMVWRHMLGDETEPVYQEKDRLLQRSPRAQQGQEDAVPAVHEHGHLGNAVPAERSAGTGRFEVVLPREKGHKYSVEHRDGLFYLRTNRDAKNFRLVTAPVSSPSPSNWKELVPHRADVLLKGVELFQDYLVVVRKIGGPRPFPRPRLSLRPVARSRLSRERLRRSRATPTPEFTAGTLPLQLPEHDHAVSVYDYDMATPRADAQETAGGSRL